MLWQRLPARSVRQVRVGSMRGVKPKTHRANPAVTQGQTGQPRADSTAPNPERRCGCGTRHDCATVSAQTTGSFHAAACQEAKAAREPLPKLRPFTCVRPQAEPIRGSEPPPGHSQRSRALPARATTAPHRSRDPVLSHRRYRPHSPADEPSYRVSALILSLSKDAHPQPLPLAGGGNFQPSRKREGRETY